MSVDKQYLVGAIGFGVLFWSCVTVHRGRPEQVENVLVSCADANDILSPRYRLISCNLENTANIWQTIQIDKINLLTEEPSTKLLPLERVNDLLLSAAHKKLDDNLNQDAAVSGLTVAGAGGTLYSGGNNATAGVAILALATTIHAARIYDQRYHDAQDARPGEKDSLIAAVFELPPQGFVRRGIIIELPNGFDAVPENMEVCFQAPIVGCRKIPIKMRWRQGMPN